jgi:hypothetical protein
MVAVMTTVKRGSCVTGETRSRPRVTQPATRPQHNLVTGLMPRQDSGPLDETCVLCDCDMQRTGRRGRTTFWTCPQCGLHAEILDRRRLPIALLASEDKNG